MSDQNPQESVWEYLLPLVFIGGILYFTVSGLRWIVSEIIR